MPVVITRVPGARLGLEYCCQPFGRGIVTVRSVNLSGSTGSPVMPMVSRYVEMGTGASALEVVVVVAGVDQIDW